MKKTLEARMADLLELAYDEQDEHHAQRKALRLKRDELTDQPAPFDMPKLRPVHEALDASITRLGELYKIIESLQGVKS